MADGASYRGSNQRPPMFEHQEKMKGVRRYFYMILQSSLSTSFRLSGCLPAPRHSVSLAVRPKSCESPRHKAPNQHHAACSTNRRTNVTTSPRRVGVILHASKLMTSRELCRTLLIPASPSMPLLYTASGGLSRLRLTPRFIGHPGSRHTQARFAEGAMFRDRALLLTSVGNFRPSAVGRVGQER